MTDEPLFQDPIILLEGGKRAIDRMKAQVQAEKARTSYLTDFLLEEVRKANRTAEHWQARAEQYKNYIEQKAGQQ